MARKRQEERKQSFQPPVKQEREGEKGEGGGGGEEVDVGEVKRKVKEAMKRRKKSKNH